MMLKTVENGNGLEDITAVVSAKTAILAILDPSGAIPECFIHAVEREFPRISVGHAASAEALCGEFGKPVKLVLVTWDCLAEVREAADRIRNRHPETIVAAVHDDKSGQMSSILGSGIVRSVLPMNLRLDIWLSVVRLMLLGVEYFPMSVVQAAAETPPSADSGQRRTGNGKALTSRENQVMALISRGHQNKHIAAELGLSEHTVKVHLHNIIAKLGVTNRTAAAALYLEGGNSRSSPKAADTAQASGRGAPARTAVPRDTAVCGAG
jgi:DNA-binding NarL/FixJ family response regulator